MQLALPLSAPGAQRVNGAVEIVWDEQRVVLFASGVAVSTCEPGDVVGLRYMACQLVNLHLAKRQEVTAAFGIDRATLYRWMERLEESGISGLVDGIPGPKGGHKLTGERLEEAQRQLDAGTSMRAAAKGVGVSEGTIRHAVKRGRLQRPVKQAEPSPASGGEPEADEVMGPLERSERSVSCSAGVGVSREEERKLAQMGLLEAAEPRFEAMEAVAYGGAFVALPALLAQGLLEGGEAVYGKLRNGFYGLSSVLLTLANMALLRIRSPERLQYHPPAELGVLLGLDRVPEVKTLRRKISELAGRKQAAAYRDWLAQRWVAHDPDAVGVLYVDGHVRPYHGRKHNLPKAHVARRRLAMDATTDFWVHDTHAEPLFVVTAEANNSLLSMLKGRILPKVRELVGKGRRVTVIFDREGWSPKSFEEMVGDDFDVTTYRKGKQEPWPEAEFSTRSVQRGHQTLTYHLAERPVQLRKGFSMREIRRLCGDGHQTAIVTTRHDLPAEELAEQIFRRWAQENFFRYMRHHYALDALLTYDVEPADPDRLVPNPQKKALTAQVQRVTTELKQLEQNYIQATIPDPKQRKGKAADRKREAKRLQEEIQKLRDQCEALKQERSATPKKVPLTTLMDADNIVRLATEEKHLVDTVRTIAYRAETALVALVAPHYKRTHREGRALVRELLEAPADVLPDPQAGLLRIRLHPLANPRSNEAVAALCNHLNSAQITYPKTDWILHYEPVNAASIIDPRQDL
jgi:transposase